MPNLKICWFAITRVWFFLVHPESDGKDSINTYLLNLIFKFFAPLHFVCWLVICNVHAIIMDLANVNPHNVQLAG